MYEYLGFFKNFLKNNYFRIITRNNVRLIIETEKWTFEQINEYHLKRLTQLLIECSRHVPFYTDMFKKNGFSPFSIKNLEDINQIPFLNKNLVRTYAKSIIHEKFKNQVFSVKSGGTTGQSLMFYSCKTHFRNWLPFIQYIFSLNGGNFFGNRIRWRGVQIDSNRFRNNYTYNPLTKFMLCKSSDLSNEYVESCLTKAKQKKINSIHAYPSVLNVLSLQNIEKKDPITFKRAYATSEVVLPVHRELVQKAFGCRLFSFYGQSERTVIATECEQSDAYHFLPTYSYVELIGEDGKPVTTNGAVGEIVGTSYQTPAFPLIRYRTGDYGVLSTGRCQCGRSWFRCSKIIGRKGEFIKLKSGTKLPLTALIYGPRHTFLIHLKKFSFYQKKNGTLVFYVVKSSNIDDVEKYKIKKSLENVVKEGELLVKVVQVHDLPSSPIQKHKLLLTPEDIKVLSNQVL